MIHVRNKGTANRPRWQYIFFVHENGKRRQKTRSGFPTKKAAQEAGLEAQYLYSTNSLTERKNLLFSEIATDYIENFIKNNRALSTYEKFKSQYSNYFKSSLENLKVKDITTSKIDEVIRNAQLIRTCVQPLSNSTLKSLYSLLNAIFNRAIKKGYIKYNPCVNADKYKSTSVTPRVLDTSEIESILSCLDTKKHLDFIFASLFEITLETGLRRGEICGLTWDCINLQEKTITVHYNLVYVEGRTYLNESPKTNSGFRILKFSDKLKDIFTALKAICAKYKLIYGSKYIQPKFNGKYYDLVFRHINGGHIHPTWPYKRLVTYLEKCNLTSATFHDIRHTSASMFLSDGGDLSTLSYRLGHQDKALTLKLYCHFINVYEKKYVDSLSQNIPTLNLSYSSI